MYHSVIGDRGILATLDIDEKINSNRVKLTELQKKRMLIEYKLNQLKSGAVNHDLIDEIMRRELGLCDAEETVIVIKQHTQ